MYRNSGAAASGLGLVLTGVPAARSTPAEQLDEAVGLTRVARDCGYDVVVAGQHFLGAPYQYLHPIPLLTCLVPESGSMRLATGVLLLALLNPVDVAEQVATLDVISGGRLIFGVGMGYRDAELRAFGVDRSKRAARMREALEVIRQMWSGTPIDHDGDFFTVHAEGSGIRPLQLPEPPIWVAAMNERSFKRSIHVGLTPYLGPRLTLAEVERMLRVYRELTGRPDACLPLRRELFIAADRRGAWADAERHIGERFDVYRTWGLEGDLASTSEDLGGYLADRVVAGDVVECSETLAKYHAIGASPVVLRCSWPSLTRSEVAQMVELAARAAELTRS